MQRPAASSAPMPDYAPRASPQAHLLGTEMISLQACYESFFHDFLFLQCFLPVVICHADDALFVDEALLRFLHFRYCFLQPRVSSLLFDFRFLRFYAATSQERVLLLLEPHAYFARHALPLLVCSSFTVRRRFHSLQARCADFSLIAEFPPPLPRQFSLLFRLIHIRQRCFLYRFSLSLRD